MTIPCAPPPSLTHKSGPFNRNGNAPSQPRCSPHFALFPPSFPVSICISTCNSTNLTVRGEQLRRSASLGPSTHYCTTLYAVCVLPFAPSSLSLPSRHSSARREHHSIPSPRPPFLPFSDTLLYREIFTSSSLSSSHAFIANNYTHHTTTTSTESLSRHLLLVIASTSVSATSIDNNRRISSSRTATSAITTSRDL